MPKWIFTKRPLYSRGLWGRQKWKSSSHLSYCWQRRSWWDGVRVILCFRSPDPAKHLEQPPPRSQPSWNVEIARPPQESCWNYFTYPKCPSFMQSLKKKKKKWKIMVKIQFTHIFSFTQCALIEKVIKNHDKGFKTYLIHSPCQWTLSRLQCILTFWFLFAIFRSTT